MGLLRARSGTDLMSGDNLNVASDYDGVLRLAPVKNLIPDPGIRDFNEAHDKHRYWLLNEPPRPTGWAPFIRDRNIVRYYSRQVSQPIPMREKVYDQIDELIQGPSPIGDDRAIDIAAPIKPEVKAIDVGPIGFPAGWYTVAYGWILGEWDSSGRYTNPGPRSPSIADTGLQLAQGQGMIIIPPEEIPRNVTGIAVFVSEPAASHAAAQSAPMYLVHRIRVKGRSAFEKLRGPFSKKHLVGSNENSTYLGIPTAGIKVDKKENYYAKHDGISVKLGYSLVTESGRSRSFRSDTIREANNKDTAIRWKPKSFPKAAKGWVPEVKFIKGNSTVWFRLEKKEGNKKAHDRDEWATVACSTPNQWPQKQPSTIKNDGKNNDEDQSGIKAPAEALELPTVLELNNSGLTMGRHLIKTALYVGEEEGPVGSETSITIPQGASSEKRALRIHRPKWHNLLDNDDLANRAVEDIDLPRGWIIPGRPFATPSTLVVRPPREGVIRYLDNSNSAVTFTAFHTPFATLSEDTNRFLVRFRNKITGYTGGAVKIWLDEYPDGADETTPASQSTLLGTFTKNHDVTRVIRLSRQTSDPVRPDVLRVATSTRAIRIRVTGIGNTRLGNRNFDVEFSHWGAFEGWAEPTKVTRLEENRHDDNDGEREDYVYPHGGYCIIRENPKQGPRKDNYTTLNKQTWETAITPWTTFTSGATGLTVSRLDEAGLKGVYGLRVRKSAVTPADNVDQLYAEFSFTARAQAALASDMYIRQFSNHSLDLMGIRTSGGANAIAQLQLTATGILNLITTNAAGTSTTTQLATGIDDEQYLSAELEVNGAGTSSGTVKAYIGLNKADRTLTTTVSGIDLTGRQAAVTRLGHSRLNLSKDAIFNIYHDNTVVSVEGTATSTALPGNYIEYYGPPRTPKNEVYGPTGMKVPVQPDEDYTISCRAYWEDVAANTDLLRVKAMDRRHRELDVFGPVIQGISGDNKDWTEFSKTIHVPEETAYIEFFANDLGPGLVKVHGIQLEKGTVASPFDMTNATSGHASVYFDAPIEELSDTDPMSRLNEVVDLENVRVLIQDEDNTSHTLQYRSGEDMTELLAASYTSDFNTLDHSDDIFEVRVNLASTDNTASSELKGIDVELTRADGLIADGNGEEYKGGTLVNNVSPVHTPPNDEEVLMASGRTVSNPWGTETTSTINFDMHCFRRSTSEEIAAEKTHVIEFPDRKYRISFIEPIEWEPFPRTRIKHSGSKEDFQMYSASGVTARVLSETDR